MSGAKVDVVLTLDGSTIVMKAGETVLDALERTGASPAFSCRSGVCHSCVMCLVDGEVDERARAGLSPGMRAKGAFLPCVCVPDSDLTVGSIDAAYPPAHGRVTQVTRVSDAVVRVLIEAEGFSWLGGQFVNVVRPDDGLSRPYSVASRGGGGALELHVEVVEDGAMSPWLAGVESGQEVLLRGPSGECIYVDDEPDRPLVLAGVGTGLAPLLGVIREALARGHRADIHLFHGAREDAELYALAELEALAETFPQVHVDARVLGTAIREGVDVGKVDDAVLALSAIFDEARVYLCGATSWVKTMQRRVFLAGGRMSRIHADAFLHAHTAG